MQREEEQDVVRHLFQRLSVLLMKGNAALIQKRIPESIDVELDKHDI